MKIAGRFSFNNGEEHIGAHYLTLLKEVEAVIANVDAHKHKTKVSKEKTTPGKLLFSPGDLNTAFKAGFGVTGWKKKRVDCVYDDSHCVDGYAPMPGSKRPFREMDFVKGDVGVEVQFGKYAFMAYNVCAKMTIFRNLGHIKAGIEIVPMWSFADAMSTGVSYFEQIVWDLTHRGVADIDVPVIVLGIAAR